MEFVRRAAGTTRVLGVFPGSFHPPTSAHLALAQAALAEVDEVVFVLPRCFPHKRYEQVGPEQRLDLVKRATEGQPRFSVAVTEGGLFLEIADECRQEYGEETGLWFLCGRDAAERIVNWDYGRSGAVEEMLGGFGLVVAPRGGIYRPPPHLAGRIRNLRLPQSYDLVSATDVRNRIENRQDWEHLVPDTIRADVRRLYGRRT